MKNTLLLIFFYSLVLSLLGQKSLSEASKYIECSHDTTQVLALITGYQGGKNHSVEIGLGFKRTIAQFTQVYGISSEWRLGSTRVLGIKAGYWQGGGPYFSNWGINLINYTDMESHALRLRPELGLGAGFFRLVYGYNVPLTRKDFAGVNRHNFAVNIILDLINLNHKR